MINVGVVLVVLYILMCGIYAYLIAWDMGSWQKGLFALAVCLALPGFGFLFLFFCDWIGRKKQEKNYIGFYIDNDYKRDELKYLREMDRDRELNKVSMSEALKLASYKYRRNMIMQLLNEEDTLQYLDVLQDALDNEDTETSHYASTVIMELQRKIQEELIEKEVFYEQNPSDREYAGQWEEILYKVLNSNLYDESNRKRYFAKYHRVSDKLLSVEMPEEIYLRNRINIAFQEENYTEGQKFCTKYLRLYPASEDAVLCQIQLCIRTKDAEGMQEFLDSLSGRPVVLTKKTLKYIRVFKRR